MEKLNDLDKKVQDIFLELVLNHPIKNIEGANITFEFGDVEYRVWAQNRKSKFKPHELQGIDGFSTFAFDWFTIDNTTNESGWSFWLATPFRSYLVAPLSRFDEFRVVDTLDRKIKGWEMHFLDNAINHIPTDPTLTFSDLDDE